MDNSALMLLGALCVGILLLAVGVVYKTMFRSKDVSAVRYSSRDAEVEAVIRKAMTDKVTFTCSVYETSSKKNDYKGSCTSLNDDTLTLAFADAPALQALNGKMVEIHFSVMFDYVNYYRFQTTVMRSRSSAQASFLDVRRPYGLVIGQRRQFVRYQPEGRILDGLELWYAVTDNEADELDWQLCSAQQFVVGDISANGISLVWLDANVKLSKGDQCVIRLNVREDEFGSPTSLLLAGETVRLSTAQGNTSRIIGIKFCRWSRFHADTGEYDWRALHSELGVPPLGDWVLEQHRMNRSQDVHVDA